MKPKPHPLAVPRRPEGQPTRGKTARNRLRRVDTFLLMYDGALLRRTTGAYARALFVDLGYGAEPITTLESAWRLRRVNPLLPVLGVEIDPERVAAALPHADERTHFRLGGFNLPLRMVAGQRETVRAVRAFNVLRQYDESEVADAYTRLAQYILPGGLLVEGTSDPPGRTWVANVLRKPGDAAPDTSLRYETLVFSTNFRHGFDPAAFQPVLPKNFIHRMVPGEPIHDLMEAWKSSALETAAVQAWGVRQWFGAAARALAARGYRVETRASWLNKGFLVVEHPLRGNGG